MSRNYDNLTEKDKGIIRVRLNDLIRSLSGEFNAYPEAIATELFYRLQRHPDYARNANKTQKNKSFAHYQGICQKCHRPVDRTKAKFHHLKRGVKGQHDPANLVPYHLDCHDDEHGALRDSLSKGHQEERPNKPVNSDRVI